MCSGPYEVKKWQPGQGLTAVANPHYWDSTLTPRCTRSSSRASATMPALTSGLHTGAISGTYPHELSTLEQLKRRPRT